MKQGAKPEMPLDVPEILAEPVAPEAAMEFWKDRAKLTWDEAKGLADGARQRAFYVTGLARKDLVELVSDAIQKALENGETLPDFKKGILAAIQTQGWHGHRVENIFRTNMQTAYSAGRYKKMMALKKWLPYWQYLAVMDRRTRPSHAVLHEKVYPAGHEFWNSNYPPNGFRCRCAVAALSERQVAAQGLKVESAMPGAALWTDPVTGMEQVVHFPGADKGFNNNPFKDWAATWKTFVAGSGKKLPKEWDYGALRGRPLTNIDSVKKDRPFGLTSAIDLANPDYNQDAAFQRNCQRCVVAFELRRRGYDVEAMFNPWPLRSGTTRRRSFNGSECFKGAKIKNIMTGDPATARKELEKVLANSPDGTRIAIYWRSPKNDEKAHIIICEKMKGKLVFGDPQCGKIGENLLKPANEEAGYRWYRMDNLELDKDFEWNEIVREARQ